ncbi:MAG: response regulator [Rubrivivax sp.]|nr:response regulator [Rubrivivax sp.]
MAVASQLAEPAEPIESTNLPAPPGAAVARRSQRDIDHLRALMQQTPASLTGNAIGIGLMLAMYGGLAAAPALLAAWGLLSIGLWLTRLWHYRRYRRHPDADTGTLTRWRRSWRALVISQGAMWGTASWIFWGLGTPYHGLALIFIVFTYCMASVQLLSAQRRIFVAFICVVMLPLIVRVASDSGHAWHWQLASLLTIIFGITALMGRTYGSALGQAIALKARTEELAGQLRVEMATAETARRAAEAASRAKTQFFAAASHDLRQPLHAMGLFAEALRQRSRDPEVAGLVNSINESVDALEGLFGELLDITRIDTGGVEVSPAPLRMRELFSRLRLHFEPTAFEKGLMLSFHGEQHVALADPVLLERILRNLVSNAIRYSDDGGVLVSCRARQGRLRLQVWDTGIGIAESALPRIFDEFYQVNPSRPLEPHQRKGLGLGLPIVKRLAALMDAPLTVRSRPGHGTVFTLEVPAGRLSRTAEAVRGKRNLPLGLTLQDRLIVVVEDEVAVREGLVVVLQAWGAAVLAFDTVSALEAWLAGAPAERPDLALVDFRLPDSRTGIDALVALRRQWPTPRLPAIMITGSSLGGHEDQAQTHDYHLLIKPVLPNKLRAMIAFKLDMR